MKNFLRERKRGFTLVELLVTSGIFATVIVAAMGIFVSALKLQRYLFANQQLVDQTSYVMEYMSRFLRVAKVAEDYSWIDKGDSYVVSNGSDEMRFLDSSSSGRRFYLSSQGEQQGVIMSEQQGGPDLPITSNKINVTSLKFYLPDDSTAPQPRVTIVIEA